MLVVDILTPESNVFNGEAICVTLPGLDGTFQLLTSHAPIISALKAGKLIVELPVNFNEETYKSKLIHQTADPKKIEISIGGGVVEVTNNKVIILAE